MKNIIILTNLSVQCERFYAAVRDVQSTCVMPMKSKYYSGKQFLNHLSPSWTNVTMCVEYEVDFFETAFFNVL